MKWIRWLPVIIPLVSAFAAYTGCENAEQVLNSLPVGSLASSTKPVEANGWGAPSAQSNVPGATYPAYTQNGSSLPAAQVATSGTGRIRIGSFNIQAFGPSKMGEPWIMERIAAVVRNFDVIAIQEIRSKDQEILNVLLGYINRDGARFNYLLGPRLGRTSSKEQYAYIFNTLTVATSPESSYTVQDEEDLLHREPLVARFITIANSQFRPFSFTLANVHTDPDEVAQEVAVLGRVYQAIASYEAAIANEDDVIMVGDFNADARKLQSVATQQEYIPTIVNAATNVAGTAQYDNILLNPYRCAEFTGNAGVLDLATYFQLSQQDVRRISDHLPVWAEFSVFEASGGIASQPTESFRQ